MFAHQKLLKIREKILLYSDVEQTKPLGELNADKVLDFSVTQTFTDMSGAPKVKIRRAGKKSIWRAHYEILTPNDELLFTVREQKAWVKVVDVLFSEIPVLGLFTGYLFNPKYNLFNKDGVVVGQIVKEPAFLESNYTLHLEDAQADPNSILPIATLTVITRERMRG